MPHIQQLDSHVADLIAAGEVVERPASVVKELVENAIDAGATAVVVEIRRGGMGMIRVTDNGCGIAPAELPTAFLRHATSKLRTEEDLGRIGTLGFRGEALAAISAVSRVEILSRQEQEPEGASLRLEGGIPGQVEAAGAPAGTTIVVRDLFYNTPARLKFMRRDSAETAAVNGLLQHLSLSHPGISFRLIKDGAEALHTPGDGQLTSAIYAALGRDFARGLVPVRGRGGDVQVEGFVTEPLMGRGSRSMQVFFANGRFIKSQLLTAALEEGYRNQIMKGKFPGCVLSVALPVTEVDVNVHPAKTQVKFAKEREVFDAVYHTVLDSLERVGAPQAAAPKPAAGTGRPQAFQSMDVRTFRQQMEAERGPVCRPNWDSEMRPSVRVADSAPRPSFYQTRLTPPQEKVPQEGGTAAREPVRSAAPGRPFVPAIPPKPPREKEAPAQEVLVPAGEAPWRLVGELLRTYIVCESEDGCVWLIDKHAAHERINFDRMKTAQEPPMRQALLAPIPAELEREDAALLLENLPLLEEFGFACEDFGDNTVLVREVPADIDAADTVSTLEEIAECLRTGRSPDERREALLHTMACKAAIKGGWVSDPAELRTLADRVQRGEIKYCPHGRPVAVKLTRYELEKMFHRA